MNDRRRGRAAAARCGMVVLAAGYPFLLRYLRTLTGAPVVDGMIGVVLGLYVCSYPAASAIDAFTHARGGLGRISWSGAGWLALNALVLLFGWLAIADGVRRLVR